MEVQTRITNVLGKNVGLTNVVQIMLFRRILPCQCRASPMWEFNPEEPQTLKHFFGTTNEGMWKHLFKAQKSWPMKTEDIGLDAENPATPVSISFPKICLIYTFDRYESHQPISLQGWTKKVERLKSPAPLPEDPATPQLMKMLVPVPYQAPKKKGKMKSKEPKDGP